MPLTTLAEAAARHTQLTRRDELTWQGHCPFHADNTEAGTFYVRNEVYNCFDCGSTGDLAGFLMHADGLSREEALRRAA